MSGPGATSPATEGELVVRRSFFWRLFRSYTALVLLCAGVIGVLVLGNARQNALRDAEADLLNLARMMAAMEAANPAHLWSAQLGRQLAEVERDTGLMVGVYFANGAPAGPGGAPADPEEAAAEPPALAPEPGASLPPDEPVRASGTPEDPPPPVDAGSAEAAGTADTSRTSPGPRHGGALPR